MRLLLEHQRFEAGIDGHERGNEPASPTPGNDEIHGLVPGRHGILLFLRSRTTSSAGERYSGTCDDVDDRRRARIGRAESPHMRLRSAIS